MNRQYPRLVLRDSSFRSNARETISRCAACGIQVCGVIKGVNGLPEVARRFRECGVTQLGTSRLEQVERCRRAGIPGPYLLIRIPGPTELPELVRLCEMSLQSERKTLDLLEQEMLSHGSLTSLQITQNTMNVDMSGMTLDQISAMFARLRLSPIVDSVSLSVASTEEGKAATIMDFTVRIELRQPEEVSQ